MTPWTIACQAPLSVEFFRQEYRSWVPCPPPGDLPNPGIKPKSSALQADSLPSETPGKPQMLDEGHLIIFGACGCKLEETRGNPIQLRGTLFMLSGDLSQKFYHCHHQMQLNCKPIGRLRNGAGGEDSVTQESIVLLPLNHSSVGSLSNNWNKSFLFLSTSFLNKVYFE